MQMRSALLLLLAAACSGSSSSRPDARAADAATDAAPDAAPDTCGRVPNGTDDDGDGIDDGVDRCVGTADPHQHDEDGDCIGDLCDPCPHVATATGDTDGDGVGDACDHDPGMQTKLFIGFGAHETTLLDTPFPAALANDHKQVIAQGALQLSYWPTDTSPFGTIETAFRITAPTATFKLGLALGVQNPADADTRSGSAGGLSDIPDLTQMRAYLVDIGLVPSPGGAMTIPELAVGSRYVLRVRVTPTANGAAHLRIELMSATESWTYEVDVASQSGVFGIATEEVSADFEYLFKTVPAT